MTTATRRGAFRESAYHRTPSKLRIEESDDAFIIKDVVILRERGNAIYPLATRQAALPLIENCKVMLDHDDPATPGSGGSGGRMAPRSYRNTLGSIRNARETGDSVRADFVLNRHHPEAKRIVADARTNPRSCGFSIRGEGDKEKTRDGDVVVRKITKLFSIDLVAEPAHGGGLFESKGRYSGMRVSIRQLREALDRKGRTKHARLLREAAQSGVLDDTDAAELDGAESEVMDDDNEPVPTGAADDAVRSGFKAAWASLFDDNSLDSKSKLKKAGLILKALDDLTGVASASSVPTSDVTEESLRRRAVSEARSGRSLPAGHDDSAEARAARVRAARMAK